MSQRRAQINPKVGGGVIAISIIFAVAGCTVHPAGEQEERDLAAQEGQRYSVRIEDRKIAPLPAQPSPDDLVRYAMLASPELEQKYWAWRAAIEQVPQDGTEPANLVLFAGVPITRGSTAFDRTAVTVSNDPMADIQWPSKPATAARRALESARAAGLRFQDAKLALREKVLDAYYEYALASELARLERENAQLLAATADVTEQGIASGKSTQAASLSARTESALSENQVHELESRFPGLLATLNVAIGRDSANSAPLPVNVPELRATNHDAGQLLGLIEQHNPELSSLDAELRSQRESIKLAKFQYVPDFSLSGGTDLGGITQNLSGMVTVPLLRHEAIDAAIAQADANFRATEAMRRQTGNELKSRVIADVAIIEDARREVTLLEGSILPRAEALIALNRSAYEGGRSSFAELLASQRSVIALRRVIASLRVAHEQRLVGIERVIGEPIH